ncbi:Coq4 family protein [Flavivirga spongiicola]|uniref:Ubiquinone biosynthesis protein COQ4 n=1 Tax=Flavivirga spongiicola TaxID=421621 RepID=A0ABU7XXC5_9FLAO|nr:Coq4 family protein [Flavivirga sp. MEBiC05379]MDO5980100.1 Coq4 family protein [Flavivirga sp. MEBiC05379]
MNLRKKLIEWLFEKSKEIYTNLFKNDKPWGIYKEQLLTYPDDSFGKNLGLFLHKNNFELISKVERHDAYHTLTGYGTKVEDEIALQYLCFGNGKRSLYLYGSIILGTIILPDYYKYYHKSYCIGKKANSFHHFDYKELLMISIHDFRQIIFSKSQINTLIKV